MMTVDQASIDNINRQFEALKVNGSASAYRALMKVAFKIKTEAQLRLTGRGHIITSRLKNSIFVNSKKMNDVLKQNNSLTYSDSNGKSYSSEFDSGTMEDNEFAIGTNVVYGRKIEFGDSYLYWALKNVNVMQSVAKDMQEDMKTGKFAR